MNRQEAITRAAFGRQPAQYLIFDIGLPIISIQVNNVILAVQNVLTLACSVRGGNRIPAFGISVINQDFRNICPLEPIRGNFVKIAKALNYLSTQATVSENISNQDFKDYVFLAFNSALEDFKAKSELTSSNKLQYPSQLQVTFVTARSAEEIHQHLEQVIPSMNIVKLRKIHLLQLVCTNEELNNTNANLKGVGFIEVTKLIGNSENLEQLFKTWLMDYDMDHEHLRLFLPSAVLLRCDMSECLINPFSLPFGHRYQMQMDFFSIQLGGSGLAKSAVNDLPIYELEVIARMESSSLCQSQLFGQPARLYPTQCWRVDWEDLLKNQQLFISLCKELQEREQYLLTKLRHHYRSSTDCLIPYFAIESDGSILLVNAVVPAELTLPARDYGFPFLSTEKFPVETLPNISLALDKLQLLENFDPSYFPSGLYNTLSRNLQHSSMNGNPELSNAIHPALDPEMPCKSRARANKKTRTNSAGKKQ